MLNSNLTVSDTQSYKFLNSKTDDSIIIGGHPLLSRDDQGVVLITSQKSAFINAVKLHKKKGGEFVVRMGNGKNPHKTFLKENVATGKSIYKLTDLVDEIVEHYHKSLHGYDLDLGDINVIFQNQANGYVKSNFHSKKMHEQQSAISHLLLSRNDDELKTNCKGTFAGFLKLTAKIDKSASNILVCLGADNWSSHSDMVGGVSGAKNILGLQPDTYFAYFDEGKSVPMIKCG